MILQCMLCGWIGSEDELVSNVEYNDHQYIDEPMDDEFDAVRCPQCGGDEVYEP